MISNMFFPPAAHLNPLLAMSATDLVVQAVITLVAVALYHVWLTGRKRAAAPEAEVAPRQPPPASAPTALVGATAIVQPVVPVVSPPEVPAKTESVPAEIAAVIAAAVAVVLQRPHRVVSMHHIGVPPHRFNVWAHEGRQHIFDSHKFR